MTKSKLVEQNETELRDAVLVVVAIQETEKTEDLVEIVNCCVRAIQHFRMYAKLMKKTLLLSTTLDYLRLVRLMNDAAAWQCHVVLSGSKHSFRRIKSTVDTITKSY
jgi:hypothetical protein